MHTYNVVVGTGERPGYVTLLLSYYREGIVYREDILKGGGESHLATTVLRLSFSGI